MKSALCSLVLLLSLTSLTVTVSATIAAADDNSCKPDEIKATPYLHCKVPLGEYALYLPTPEHRKPGSKMPALLYFHGGGGSGPKALRNKGMREAFSQRGYAIIAPSGLKRPNSRFGPGLDPDRPDTRPWNHQWKTR